MILWEITTLRQETPHRAILVSSPLLLQPLLTNKKTKKHLFQVLYSIPSVLNGLLPTAHFLLLFFSGVRAVLEFSHCLFVSRFSSVIGVDVVFALFSNFLNSLHKWLNTVKLNIHICLLRSFLCFFRSFLWTNASSHWLHLFCPFSTVRELCVSGLI